MELTIMSSLLSLVQPSLSQPKPTWANPAVFSAGVGLLKMKTSRLVVVGNNWIRPQEGFVPPRPSPKSDPNGNPQFVIFVRNADLKEWFPLMKVEGSSTAKLILRDKETTEDTITGELASVIYKDEREIEKEAKLKLNNATEFRYGFKLVENGNMAAAAENINVIELPRKEERKSAWDKVKKLFPRATNEAKEPFGKLTSMDP
ncbi:protein HHL1, chloroplastic-like [Carex rostrata]